MAERVNFSVDYLEAHQSAKLKVLEVGGDPKNSVSGTDVTDQLGITGTWTLGTAAAGSQAATLQLKDGSGTNLTYAAGLPVYYSDVATGLTYAATGPDSFSATTGAVLAVVAKKLMRATTDATGKAVIATANSGSGVGFYLVAVLPNGQLAVSEKIIPTPA